MIFFSSNQSYQKIIPFYVLIKNEKQVESVIFQLRSLNALRLYGFILLSQLETQWRIWLFHCLGFPLFLYRMLHGKRAISYSHWLVLKTENLINLSPQHNIILAHKIFHLVKINRQRKNNNCSEENLCIFFVFFALLKCMAFSE